MKCPYNVDRLNWMKGDKLIKVLPSTEPTGYFNLDLYNRQCDAIIKLCKKLVGA